MDQQSITLYLAKKGLSLIHRELAEMLGGIFKRHQYIGTLSFRDQNQAEEIQAQETAINEVILKGLAEELFSSALEPVW
jgi:hypothetical protein